MVKTICIFGAGGFAREVFWLAKQCGCEVEAFIDMQSGSDYRGVKIEDENYFDPSKHLAVVAVGNPRVREIIATKIINRHGTEVFKTLIHPKATLMDSNIQIGFGSVICANCILTCDVQLGSFAQLNLSTTIGHDTATGDFFTTAPGAHISGHVKTGDRVYLGTNSSTVEDIAICSDVTIGAGACVVKDIVESGTYVGVPAKKLGKI